MATQIQNISICNSNTSLLISVTPLVIFKANQSAWTEFVKRINIKISLFGKFFKDFSDIFLPYGSAE
jgi:hypothetical protein|tara:strand:+ start:3477 stop:3677 length:201 start_codon:yes stop_codon:yes gene_type:complete